MKLPNKHTRSVLGRPHRTPEPKAKHIKQVKHVDHVKHIPWCILVHTTNLVDLNPRRAEMRTTTDHSRSTKINNNMDHSGPYNMIPY